MSTKNGGAAFPWTKLSQHPMQPNKVRRQDFSGMSLRDYFAGQALAAMDLSCYTLDYDETSFDNAAKAAYAYADAMIEERKRERKDS